MPESKIHTLDPLTDERWPKFVQQNPRSSVFHSRTWLSALKRAYQYEPIAFTTSAPSEELKNAIVFCAVRSWLTGRRLVSLPFSDHCDPLVEDPEELRALVSFLERVRKDEGWKYVEIRPADFRMPTDGAFREAGTYYLHRLSLSPDLDHLLSSFHKDSVQRKIRRAEREGLDYQAGRSDRLLQQLYELLTLTRQRHGVPPQPLEWFRILADCMGDNLCVRIASKDGRPVAAILTLRHGQTVVYKYGGSDARMNHLGGMALLFWKTIQEARQAGAEEFDLGRSDCDNPGLIAFKEHWAAQRSTLTYWRCQAAGQTARGETWKMQFAKEIFARLPQAVLTRVGRLVYRHMG